MKYMNSFYKSLDFVDGQLQLSSLDDGNKIVSESLINILQNSEISPNTIHPSFPKRLCVNAILGWYAGGSYRDNGIFFHTKEEPDYCCPFDVMLLTKNPEDISATNRAQFIEGYEKFLLSSLEELFEKFSSPAYGKEALNRFRVEHGEEEIGVPIYNECAFFRKIKIVPLALYGPNTEDVAKRFNLDYYPDVMDMSRVILYSSKYWQNRSS
ncbi:MAG: hypothetical protein V3V78_04595 [Candidatus Woesearchaeota archaeon]